MKAFITLPKNAVFPTFFTDENIVVEQFAAKTPVHAHEFF